MAPGYIIAILIKEMYVNKSHLLLVGTVNSTLIKKRLSLHDDQKLNYGALFYKKENCLSMTIQISLGKIFEQNKLSTWCTKNCIIIYSTSKKYSSKIYVSLQNI